MKLPTRNQGFTIIELLVVVIVLAILVSIVIVGYGAWRQRAAVKEVNIELSLATTAMKNELTFNNQYPTSLPAAYQPGNGVTVTYKAGGDTTKYCLEAKSKSVPSVVYYVNTTTATSAKQGTCPNF